MRRLHRMKMQKNVFLYLQMPEMDSAGQIAPTRVSLMSSRPPELLIGQLLRNVRACE
jgi:hypothetical protein